jgi:hypothetical protein
MIILDFSCPFLLYSEYNVAKPFRRSTAALVQLLYVPRYSCILQYIGTLLWLTNWPPRYLSEFLIDGPVAGPVIYYLFEILNVVWATSQGQLCFIFWKS